MSVEIPDGADRYGDPTTIHSMAMSLATMALLRTLEKKHPGIRDEIRAELQNLIGEMNAARPEQASSREKLYDTARLILA